MADRILDPSDNVWFDIVSSGKYWLYRSRYRCQRGTRAKVKTRKMMSEMMAGTARVCEGD
jgi:hypothetical protein